MGKKNVKDFPTTCYHLHLQIYINIQYNYLSLYIFTHIHTPNVYDITVVYDYMIA